MKLILHLIFLILIPLCSYAAPPEWVRVLPNTHSKVYGVGLGAVTSTETKAIEVATQAARFEVLAQLRSNVKADTSVHSFMSVSRSTNLPVTASSQQHVTFSGKTSVEAEKLPGLVIEERYVDLDSRTAYVLAYLDIKAVELSAGNELQAIRKDIDHFKLRDNLYLLSTFQELLKLNQRAVKMYDLVSLIAPLSGDTRLQQQAQALMSNIVQSLRDMKRQVTVGMLPGTPISKDLKLLLRESVNGKGLIWSDQNPAIILDVQVRSSNQEVNIHRKAKHYGNQSSDFIGIRTTLSCSLKDSSGNTYGSFEVDAKGVGIDEYTAKRALGKDLRTKLPAKLQEAIDSQLQI